MRPEISLVFSALFALVASHNCDGYFTTRKKFDIFLDQKFSFLCECDSFEDLDCQGRWGSLIIADISLYFGHIAQIISGCDDWKMTLTKTWVQWQCIAPWAKIALQDELQVGERRRTFNASAPCPLSTECSAGRKNKRGLNTRGERTLGGNWRKQGGRAPNQWQKRNRLVGG